MTARPSALHMVRRVGLPRVSLIRRAVAQGGRATLRRGESVSPPFRPSGWLRGSTGDAPCAASSCKRTSNATTWSRCTRAARSTTTSLRYRRCISVVTSSRTASSSAVRDVTASAGGARRRRMLARPRCWRDRSCWRDRTGDRNVQRMFKRRPPPGMTSEPTSRCFVAPGRPRPSGRGTSTCCAGARRAPQPCTPSRARRRRRGSISLC